MTTRIAIEPALFRWAMERSRKPDTALSERFPKLGAWLSGESAPTLKQLEDFSQATHAPLGYLFLPEPPEERLPIPDFRTLSGTAVRSPSADLLDTLYTMQQRQWWLRETLVEADGEPLGIVGSARLSDRPEAVAAAMREALGLQRGWARGVTTWKDAISALRHAIQELGVMAVINGVVGNNTHRKLDVAEFRGFALCDPYAPLIFVNGADTKSAQIFTLAHELAHVWIGREGLSGFEGLFPDYGEVERFCNHVAAEFLVPARELEVCWAEACAAAQPYEFLARRFKVSPIVAARRAMDLRLISREAFFAFYKDYTAQERHLEMRRKEQGKGGGDFYNNQNTRVGERFALEVFRAAKEGRVMYTEAYRLTGLQGAAFRNYAQALGIEV